MIRSLASLFFYGNKMYFLQVIIGLGLEKTLTKLVRDSAPQKASQYSSYPPSDTTNNKIGKEPCWKAQQHVLLSTSKPNFICKTDHHKWKSRKRWLLEILCWNDLPSGHSFWVTPNYLSTFEVLNSHNNCRSINHLHPQKNRWPAFFADSFMIRSYKSKVSNMWQCLGQASHPHKWMYFDAFCWGPFKGHLSEWSHCSAQPVSNIKLYEILWKTEVLLCSKILLARCWPSPNTPSSIGSRWKSSSSALR